MLSNSEQLLSRLRIDFGEFVLDYAGEREYFKLIRLNYSELADERRLCRFKGGLLN